MMGNRILFVTPYPKGTAGSQRFRFEHYYKFLEDAGYQVNCRSFLDEGTWEVLYKPGNSIRKSLGILAGFVRRFLLLFTLGRYDFVFVHREASPLGPPFFEYICARVMRKRMIFDFDDSIWLPNSSGANRYASFLKMPGKVNSILSWSWKVSAGNEHIAGHARKYNPRVSVIPSVVDTNGYHNRLQDQSTVRPNIGWTGTHSTLAYLDPLIPVLQELEKQYPFRFIVIAEKKPEIKLKSLEFIPWNKETEIADLLRFHIGLMPLPDDPWSRGKCGFKAIQYMALGIPALVSPVGVNSRIVTHGKDGFHCSTDEDWKEGLGLLLRDAAIRIDMGKLAREKIVGHYSVDATKEDFINLFK